MPSSPNLDTPRTGTRFADEIRHERTRERAFFASKAAGDPPGKQQEFWDQAVAQEEVLAERGLTHERGPIWYPLTDPGSASIASRSWNPETNRGFGKTTNWDGKYLYGAYSSLVASYVIGIEYADSLGKLANWRNDEASADRLIKEMWARYQAVGPKELAALVEMSNKKELGEIFRTQLNAVATPRENLDFMENTMADYGGLPGIDASRMDDHDQPTRRTLEPVSKRWERPEARSFEAELHRGAYANSLGIPQNTVVAYLAGYFAGDRAFETDILDAKDKVAIVAHDFALNRLRGEYYAPGQYVSAKTAEEVGKSSYGIVDPDLNFPNARETPFRINTLDNLSGFFDRYMPEASLSLDARNMSSITAIGELNKHYDTEGNFASPARPLATGVKVYPFLLAHGYEHALVEYVSRTRENAGIEFEDLKFWSPQGHEPKKVPEDFRTDAEKRIAELDTATDAKAEGDRNALRRTKEMQPPTIDDRKAFDRALKRTPLVLSIGGVVAGKPAGDTVTKGINTSFLDHELKLERAHQGSDSVLRATTLTGDGDENVWRAKMPFGCVERSSDWEHELVKHHNVAPFSEAERNYISANTLKLFQWIATFAPHMHEQSTVQFEAKPSLTEILVEARAVRTLTERTRTTYNIDEDYRALGSLESSSIKNRITLLDAAVIDNVRELGRRVGVGEIRVSTRQNGSDENNHDDVQAAFAKLRYSAFDRYSDFTLAAPALGSASKTTNWTYFVVQGRIDQQARSSANQTGQLSHTPYWVRSSTTDLPVEFKQIYQHRALHLVDGESLPYPGHITTSQRSVLVRDHSDEDNKPHGVVWGSWDPKAPMPSKDSAEEKAGKHLDPYMQETNQAAISAAKREDIVQRVKAAAMR